MPSATRATAERIISEKTAAGDAVAAGGNYPAAVLCYSAALKMRSSAELLTKRARCHEVLADHLAALGDLSLLCRLEPANWSHRLGRASLFRELGQLTSSPGALLDLDEAVSLAATAPERERSALLSTRAGVREEAAQWGEAVEDYSLLLELLPAEPADKTAAAERARVQLRRGCCGLRMHAKSESGMRDLLEVVELAPSLPDARLQLGRALRQMGEFAAADIELAEGLTQAVAAHRPSHDAAHHPLHAALLRERARVLCCLRRPEEALPLLRKACEAEPAEAADTLALGAAMLQVRLAPLRTCTAHPHCCPPALLPTRTAHPHAASPTPGYLPNSPLYITPGQAAGASARGVRERGQVRRGGARAGARRAADAARASRAVDGDGLAPGRTAARPTGAARWCAAPHEPTAHGAALFGAATAALVGAATGQRSLHASYTALVLALAERQCGEERADAMGSEPWTLAAAAVVAAAAGVAPVAAASRTSVAAAAGGAGRGAGARDGRGGVGAARLRPRVVGDAARGGGGALPRWCHRPRRGAGGQQTRARGGAACAAAAAAGGGRGGRGGDAAARVVRRAGATSSAHAAAGPRRGGAG